MIVWESPCAQTAKDDEEESSQSWESHDSTLEAYQTQRRGVPLAPKAFIPTFNSIILCSAAVKVPIQLIEATS